METLTIANFVTLGMLILLQGVLGFDNLLYISLESKRAPEAERSRFLAQIAPLVEALTESDRTGG